MSISITFTARHYRNAAKWTLAISIIKGEPHRADLLASSNPQIWKVFIINKSDLETTGVQSSITEPRNRTRGFCVLGGQAGIPIR